MVKKSKPRDTYKYELKIGNKVIHRDVTSNLERRTAEHRSHIPESHVVKIGRKTTREQAIKWKNSGE